MVSYVIREGSAQKRWDLGRKFTMKQLKIFLSICEHSRVENESKIKVGRLVSQVTGLKFIIMPTCAVSKRLARRQRQGLPVSPLAGPYYDLFDSEEIFFQVCHWQLLQCQVICVVSHLSSNIRAAVKGCKEYRFFIKVWMNDGSKSSLQKCSGL